MRRHARKATSKGCVGPAFHILLHGMLHPAWVVLLPGLGLLILEPANLIPRKMYIQCVRGNKGPLAEDAKSQILDLGVPVLHENTAA